MRIHQYVCIPALFIAAGLVANHDVTKATHIPIVLHGLSSKNHGMEPTIQLIRKYLGNEVYIKNVIPSGLLFNTHDQAEYFRKEVETDPKLQNGFNVIAHSHAGLVVRYYIERYNNPPVHTYISYGTPQQGVFGMPGTLDDHFEWLNVLEERAHQILYSWSFQQYVPFAGYWHDTLHYDDYIKKAVFLPCLNNEIDHEYAAFFKANLCRLSNMVLIMSQYEQTIEPAISCHFGFYKKGSKSEIEQIQDTELYQRDTIGLRTLHEHGKLHLRYAQCPHYSFPEDEKNFVENTVPFLLSREHSNASKAICGKLENEQVICTRT